MIRRFATILTLIWIGLPGLMAQKGSGPAEQLRQAFEDIGVRTIWQLQFHGYQDDGEGLKLYMAYSDRLYLSCFEKSDGSLHFFEGKYDPARLEWVQYSEDIVQGFFKGSRKDGLVAGEWMNSQRSEGKQVYLVQDGLEFSERVPLAGAVYYMSGSLNGKPVKLLLDWQSDGRIQVDLYAGGQLVPTRFYREDHFPGPGDWMFTAEDGDELLHLDSPVFNDQPGIRLERDKLTIEFGRFTAVQQWARRTETYTAGISWQLENLIPRQGNFDKKMRQWMQEWTMRLPQHSGEAMVWIEATGAADELIFGRCWADIPGETTLHFRPFVLDLKSERILEMSEIFDQARVPGRGADEDQLVWEAGSLCWEGPQHRIIGRTRNCQPFSSLSGAVHKKFSGRIKNAR